jgi:hypothetical protein
VEKYGAAGTGAGPRQIEVEHDDYVVEAVVPPQTFVTGRIRQADRTVVPAVGGIVTPAKVGSDRDDRQHGPRPAEAIRTIVDGEEPESASRRAAVAFALPASDAGPAERRLGPEMARNNDTAASTAWRPPDDDPAQAAASGHSPDHL